MRTSHRNRIVSSTCHLLRKNAALRTRMNSTWASTPDTGVAVTQERQPLQQEHDLYRMTMKLVCKCEEQPWTASRARTRTGHDELEDAQDDGDAVGLCAGRKAGVLKDLAGVVQHAGLPGDLLEEHERGADRKRASEAALEQAQHACRNRKSVWCVERYNTNPVTGTKNQTIEMQHAYS